MQIANQTAVSFHYILTDDLGETIDTTQGGEPLAYLHGMGNIIPGLENAMQGKKVGDKFNIRIEPKEAYGDYSEDLVQVVPRSMFNGIESLEAGMQFHAALKHGNSIITVLKVDGNDITVDGNHPMAGKALVFDVEIVDVRQATKEEKAHGHIHGPGCHH